MNFRSFILLTGFVISLLLVTPAYSQDRLSFIISTEIGEPSHPPIDKDFDSFDEVDAATNSDTDKIVITGSGNHIDIERRIITKSPDQSGI